MKHKKNKNKEDYLLINLFFKDDLLPKSTKLLQDIDEYFFRDLKLKTS